MKFLCPCGQFSIEVDYNTLMKNYCTMERCPKCNEYLVKFRDRLGVTYCSKYLSNIQEMRDEEKRRKIKPKSRSTNGNRRGRKRDAPKTNRPDSIPRGDNDPSQWSSGG